LFLFRILLDAEKTDAAKYPFTVRRLSYAKAEKRHIFFKVSVDWLMLAKKSEKCRAFHSFQANAWRMTESLKKKR